MWSNVISVDKAYDREIEYVLSKLNGIKDLSYAVEENEDRIWIYLASACEKMDAVEDGVIEIIRTVFLSFFKLRYFYGRLRITVGSLSRCALVCSMLHFDSDFEGNIVRKVLSEIDDFNLDGIYNFRLRALRESWSEMIEVANRLVDNSLDDSEIFDIAAFITGSDNEKNQLLIKNGSIKNLTLRRKVEIVRLFDNDEFNLLSAIILESPGEIVLEGAKLSSAMCSTLRRIARVIEK